MKLKVWCVCFDGRIVGYFSDYTAAVDYVMDRVAPSKFVNIRLMEIFECEETF